ncbi:MAG: low temperature requirement protein A [Gammaproteobacteria bacterium]
MHETHTLLRRRGGHEGAKVEMVELFFDLVFVFAVTQLSHSLLKNPTLQGAAQVGLLLVALWVVWIYTSWVTNWLDPEHLSVRVCLFVLMLAGLVVSASIPDAFKERGLLFACALAFMHVGRALFVLWAVRGTPRAMVRNFQRIFVWLCLSGTCWIIGGLHESDARYVWWLAALALDLLGPWVFFWVPGLGRSQITDWDVEGGHIAERCALFVIIALGESLLVTGATFSEMEWNGTAWIALMVTVVGSILMWWVYFDTGAERATRRIRQASDPGRQARSAYTYVHLLIVAGIIVCAVADELVLAHPDHGTSQALVVILAGPACYLVGTLLFKWITNDRRSPPLSHLIGLALLAVLVWPAAEHLLSPLWLSAGTTGVLGVVAVWESIAVRRRSPQSPGGQEGTQR